jgi:hypothetical protein
MPNSHFKEDQEEVTKAIINAQSMEQLSQIGGPNYDNINTDISQCIA